MASTGESSKAKTTADQKDHTGSYLLKNILWMDETEVELFGKSESRHIWCTTFTEFYKKGIKPVVQSSYPRGQ